ncbi:hypothetical protein M9H77_14036 [Catharanthus roseus]|uniref:Uncharacterized protein n=1 Tax=Catharanthus roseus TaxID=4058 RepID=A0ACC0BLV3_CATRO|nr:hypothetical protein M9H77_14036 [Catharanthus roseus]
MSSIFTTKYVEIKEKLSQNVSETTIWKFSFLISCIVFFFFFFYSTNHQYFTTGNFSSNINVEGNSSNSTTISPTTINHLLFGLIGSEKAWHHRKAYIESWWRPHITKGYLFLDVPPTKKLLPWSKASPPYRVSKDLTKFVQETRPIDPVAVRIINGIMETFREENDDDKDQFRWLVMGDDDSIFFLENMVDFLGKHDHRKYYYFGAQSEYVLSNFWYSFNQGFGGAGFILSYPLAKALADYLETCLRKYPYLGAADLTTMACISDIGVNLSPQKGLHQIDLRGDISGFLSSHPKTPLLSLHHFDAVDPIFPKMDRFESTRHLMKAAKQDQSRMLQQTICYQRQQNWSISISWGYSVHIYEKIMPRNWLQKPIETFQKWNKPNPNPPHYMFNTRFPSNDPCEAPHEFYFKSIEKVTKNQILTTYIRSKERGLPVCGLNGSNSADLVSEIHVYSPTTKRTEVDRCECCDITYYNGTTMAMVKFRECHVKEIIA